MERNLGAAWEFKGCRPITRVLCEEEAGRRGKEEEFTTLRRHRREKPSAQVSKSQGEREPERAGTPETRDLCWQPDWERGEQAWRGGLAAQTGEGRASEDGRQPRQQLSKDQAMLCKMRAHLNLRHGGQGALHKESSKAETRFHLETRRSEGDRTKEVC